MSKYSFERLGSGRFERLTQALLEKLHRLDGNLVQFGDGKDGAREATWTQPVHHPQYKRPVNEKTDVPKEWVFQAKYHDIGLRGWDGARAEVESELSKELNKIVNKYKVPCHKYILITNVPFSGARHVGTRDKVNIVRTTWLKHIPEIEVWDAVDLSRMLDADPDTRTTYLDDILPGDVLRAFLANLNFDTDRRKSAFHTYLKSVLGAEHDAKAEEAGDESGLPLEKIFVDIELELVVHPQHACAIELAQELNSRPGDPQTQTHIPNSPDNVPSSFAFIRAGYKFMLLKGGPGVGKSTVTQFLTLYHAARLVDRDLANELVQNLKLTGGVTPAELEAHSRVRFPLRVELRRYAQWTAERTKQSADTFLARYLAERIGRESSADLTMDDIFALASTNPLLLILDGLDEVPNPSLRESIFRELGTFISRCDGESCDLQLILSSRPQGYRGEFDGFDPIEWKVVDLRRPDFDDYADRWLNQRIPMDDEREDARRRIAEGMQAPAVQQLATTLLQATVMLTIARRKHAIPHARQKLYEKYVDVIFERERNKETVRERSDELKRLHEVVGFELIRKMELPDGAGPLPRDHFKQLVYQVIQDYGPKDLGDASIRMVVSEIATMAKDRLCLLAGKGDGQEDVDFVIQPFREYFAAAYLAHHESGDPDRVYRSLVARRSVWGNVLQFYVAFQTQALQRNWIVEADGVGVDERTPEGVVELARRRHSLVRLLPEFQRPKNEYVQRAFENLFHWSTRWTWYRRQDTTSLLRAFAQNESFTILRNLFCDFSVDDPGTLFVEVDLLARTMSPADRQWVRATLEQMCGARVSRDIALEIAITNDIDMAPNTIPIAAFRGMQRLRMEIGGTPPAQFVNGLSDDQLVDLIFLYPSAIPWAVFENPKRAWINQLSSLLHGLRMTVDLHSLHVSFPPFLSDRSERDTNDIEDELRRSDAQIAAYLLAVLLAIKKPYEPALYENARAEEVKLSGALVDDLAVAYQLGPAPSEFVSKDAWASWRRHAFSLSDSIADVWVKDLSGDDGSCLTLFIHPDAWPELETMMPPERFTLLMKGAQTLAKVLSPHSVLPVRLHGWSAERRFDPFQACECVVDIIKKHGPRRVQLDGHLVYFVSRGPTKVTQQGASRLLRKAKEIELPPAWAGLVVRLCGAVDESDLEELLTFWARHFCRQIILENESPQNKVVIRRLLERDTADAIRLAAFLASVGTDEPIEPVSDALTERIVRALCKIVPESSGENQIATILLLFQQVPHPSEISTLSTPQAIRLMQEDPWLAIQMCGRIAEMVDPKHNFNKGHLWNELAVLVEKRREFPHSIPNAALNALIYLGETMCDPLADHDWQNSAVKCR